MTRIYLLLFVAMTFMVSCSEPVKDEQSSNSELELNRKVSGTISPKGDVDWYNYSVVEANRIIQVKVSSNTLRPDVDLLVTVYKKDDQGNKVRLHAVHAQEESLEPADLTLNIFIDEPQDLYISVRDLMDDDSSDNKYYLSIMFEGEAEGNDSFSEATEVVVNDETGCKVDSIGYIGDVDVFKFTAATDGIYHIKTEFSPSDDTDVELTFNLYDSDGALIDSLITTQSFTYDMRPPLTAGDYYVLIDDFGKNNSDDATYTICVDRVDSDEVKVNDSQDSAQDVTDLSSINGSLDYGNDQDWYMFKLPGNETTDIQVINLSFETTADVKTKYQVDIIDSDGVTLLSHKFNNGSEEYENIVKTGSGPEHYLVVKPVEEEAVTEETPYSFTINVLNIEDPGEVGDGNNSITTATALISSANHADGMPGKILFRGDEDWYKLTVAAAEKPQILEVFLEAETESIVEYDVRIIRDDVVIKRMYDSNGNDGPTKLKTSIFIPETGASEVIYYFKVSDYHDNDGANNTYKIRANLNSIPETLPKTDLDPVVYYNELTKEADDSTTKDIKLVYNALTSKTYKANTTLLYMKNPVDGTTIVEDSPIAGLTTIIYPWVSGYIDYQSDQDWFVMPNVALNEGDDKWYYDIKVELVVADPGSSVEYVWKFYPRNNDGKVMDRTSGTYGLMVASGDTSVAVEPLNDVFPEAGNDRKFWIGNLWEGDTYFSISDFNYVTLPGSYEESNPDSDDDWGYDVPYAFRVTLVYHPGMSNPPE